MNVKDAYVIAQINTNTNDMADYLIGDDEIPMKFKTKKDAIDFIMSIAPPDFDLDTSPIKIYRIH
jgi:hypothetical protein